jgi:hypothetical protein
MTRISLPRLLLIGVPWSIGFVALVLAGLAVG